jgi:predicted AlkP superfamily phosphohydrolase/phosphomutase
VEAARFERQVRTEASEIFIVYGGARRIGRADLHYARFEVHATLVLEVELTDDEVQQLIDQMDEELVQTHDPEREDFLVTVYRGEELGFYSDEYDSDEDEDDEEDEEEER